MPKGGMEAGAMLSPSGKSTAGGSTLTNHRKGGYNTMEKIKSAKQKTTSFIDKAWIITVRIAQVVAAIGLFKCGETETVVGALPIAQILAAILIADVVLFVAQLLGAQDRKK